MKKLKSNILYIITAVILGIFIASTSIAPQSKSRINANESNPCVICGKLPVDFFGRSIENLFPSSNFRVHQL